MKPRFMRRTAPWALVVLLLAVTVDYFAYPYGMSPAAPTADSGENGLWLRYTWYFGQHTDEEVRQLAPALSDHEVRYAYFHVRFVERSGRLHFCYPENARRLNDTLHRAAPGVHTIAWVYAGNERGAGNVNLADVTVRHRMAEAARWLTTACGFDGVQWDYEICLDGDPGLLALLRETRAALPPGKTLSIATALRAPEPFRSFGYGWGDEYFRQIAALSDQVVVMGYDSGLYLPRAYVALMRRQVTAVTRAVRAGNPACRVLIGVPTYERGGPSHHAHAESLAFALRGVREGAAQLGRDERRAFAGVALFADYTTDTDEWATYRRLWLARE
jgi:spore germination protein YaaH